MHELLARISATAGASGPASGSLNGGLDQAESDPETDPQSALRSPPSRNGHNGSGSVNSASDLRRNDAPQASRSRVPPRSMQDQPQDARGCRKVPPNALGPRRETGSVLGQCRCDSTVSAIRFSGGAELASTLRHSSRCRCRASPGAGLSRSVVRRHRNSSLTSCSSAPRRGKYERRISLCKRARWARFRHPRSRSRTRPSQRSHEVVSVESTSQG